MPFGPGQAGIAGSDDTAAAGAPRLGLTGQLAKHATMNIRVAHDAAARLGAAGLELRLDEHERAPGAPTGSRAGERRRQCRTRR